jgi:hypothetical protein
VLAVGDEQARFISLSKDMNLEDFRVFVRRSNSYDMLVESGNVILNDLYARQIIDKATFADLYGRATADRIATSLRKMVKTEAEMGRMQAEQEQMNAEQENQTMQAISDKEEQQQVGIQEQKNIETDKKLNAKLQQIVTKEQAKATYNPK